MRMDFASLVYDHFNDFKSLLENLDSALGATSHVLTAIPFGSERPPDKIFERAYGNRVFKILRTSNDVMLFELHFSAGAQSESLEGKFFICKHPLFDDVYIAVTIESPDFVRRALLPFIEQNRSQLYLAFLRQEQLYSLVKGFLENLSMNELRVVRASLVSRFKEETISSVSWTSLDLEGVFRFAEEQNGWFRSLSFEILKEKKALTNATVHRNGVIKTDGQLLSMYAKFLSPICQTIHENINLFAKRSRTENPRFSVRPLVVEFKKDQFEDVKENAKFINAIRRLKNASVSVMHGNPYVYLTVVDYVDGSTFDLWVLNLEQVFIVPQMKSTVAGINRLINCVFDNYDEGIIKDFEPASV